MTEASAAGLPDGDEPMPDEDGLLFTTHDLGRETRNAAPLPEDDVTFAPAPRPGEVAAAAAAAARRGAGRATDGSPGAGAVDAARGPAGGGFQVFSSSTSSPSRPEQALPWTVRDSAPPAAPPRRGWSARQSGSFDRSAQDTMRRLREDAVHVSWRMAWVAVNSVAGRASHDTDL